MTIVTRRRRTASPVIIRRMPPVSVSAKLPADLHHKLKARVAADPSTSISLEVIRAVRAHLAATDG